MSSGIVDINGIFAFSSGILSFFSPCILPLVPSYLIFISGITFDHYNEAEFRKYRKSVLLHSLAFILGFSFVFVTLGISSSLIGKALAGYQVYITRIGGILLIVMGLYYLDLLKVPFLNRERMIHLKEKPLGFIGSFVVGITFSLGWTPCVGPALSSILLIAATTNSVFEGGYLLALYSAGLAIPFIISSVLFDRLFALLKRYGSIVRYSMKVLGVLLIIIGVLLFTSYYNVITFKIGQLFTF
jgi:cytochrome c-type biogenesis protein